MLHPTILHAEIVHLHIGLVAGYGPETAMLSPSTRRPQFSANCGVHAAVDGPIERIAENEPFARRAAETGNKKSGFSRHFLCRMLRVGKERHRHLPDLEGTSVDSGLGSEF